MKALVSCIVVIFTIIVLMCTFATPVSAWTSAYTGWYNDFDSVYAEFGMGVYNYYENNTQTSIKLGWSTYNIDNWGTHEWGTLGKLRNRIWYAEGLRIDYEAYPTIDPGEYYVGNVTLGETTYSKVSSSPEDAVIVDTLACEWQIPFNGSYDMLFWENGTITVDCYP